MWDFILWFRDAWILIIGMLNTHLFSFGGISVSLLEILLGLLALALIISIFWKGARA